MRKLLYRRSQRPIEINWHSPQAKGLVAAYLMMTARGQSVLRNLASGQHHVAFQGGTNNPTVFNDPERGPVLLFDDTNTQYLQVETCPVNGLPLTMTGWFYSNDNTVNQAILFAGDGTVSNVHFALRFDNTDSVTARHRFGAGSNNATTSGGVTLNAWNHAAGVFASTTLRTAYVNGGGAATNTVSTPDFNPPRTTLGRSGDSSPQDEWSGMLDDVRLYNVAKTAEEINEIYNNSDDLYIIPRRVWAFVPAGVTEFLNASGSVTPTGTIIRQPQSIYAGVQTAAGAIIRDVLTAYAGVVNSSGNPIAGIQTSYAGSVTPSGDLSTLKLAILSVSGAITATGNLIKDVLTSYTGVQTASGNPILGAETSYSGSVTPTGDLSVLKIVLLSIAGTVTAMGNLIKSVLTAYAGVVGPGGNPIAGVQTTLAGSVTPSGVLSLVSSAITIVKRYFKGMYKGMFKGEL